MGCVTRTMDCHGSCAKYGEYKSKSDADRDARYTTEQIAYYKTIYRPPVRNRKGARAE